MDFYWNFRKILVSFEYKFIGVLQGKVARNNFDRILVFLTQSTKSTKNIENEDKKRWKFWIYEQLKA